jgi:hypothetical protein
LLPATDLPRQRIEHLKKLLDQASQAFEAAQQVLSRMFGVTIDHA